MMRRHMRISGMTRVNRMNYTIVPHPFMSSFLIIIILVRIPTICEIIRIKLSKYLHGSKHRRHEFRSREVLCSWPFFYQSRTVMTTHSVNLVDELIEIWLECPITIGDHKWWPLCPVQNPTHWSVFSWLEFFYCEGSSDFTMKSMILVMLFFPSLKWCFPEVSMQQYSETMWMLENIPPAHGPWFLFWFVYFCFF